MKEIGISTQLFGDRLVTREVLATIRDAGFTTLEAFAAPGHFEWQDASYVAQIASAIRELGLRVFSMHAPWALGQDIAAPTAQGRAASLQAVQRSVDALLTLGGDVLVLHPGSVPDAKLSKAEQLALSRESIAEVTAYCAPRGVTVALENPPPYELGGNNADLMALYRTFADQPVVQSCFDTGHAHVSAEGVAFVSQVPKDVLLVHISDNHGESDEHLPPWQGTIDWPGFFAMLRDRHFDGCLMLELADIADPAQVLHDGWAWMNDALELV